MSTKKMTIGSAIVAGVAVLTLSTTLFAAGKQLGPPAGPGLGAPPGPAFMIMRMLGQRLGITDAQRDQIRSIIEAQKPTVQPLFERVLAARAALTEAAVAGVDDGTLRLKANELAAAESDLALATARIQGQVFQILTPEQQQQLVQFRDQLKGRIENWFARPN